MLQSFRHFLFRRFNPRPQWSRDEAGRIRWGQFVWRVFRWFSLWFLVLSVFSTMMFRFVPVPFTPLMLLRLGEQAWDSEREMRLQKDWVCAEHLSKHLKSAVVAAEDQRFAEHQGFDFEAIEKAVEHNKTHKRKRGASTISQQTAKNVFLWPSRSWLRKGLEVYFTALIEWLWSKERILSVYLNVAEFGDGIYGAEAAAQHFFKKNATKLNREEAALLAAVLPSPLRYSAKKPSNYVRKRQHWILRQMEY